MSISEKTVKYGKELNIEIGKAEADKIEKYAKLLLEWNEKVNLTAITEEDEVAVKHFVDSLTVLKYIPETAVSLIDVGTGAGFPGIPLKIMRPDLKITLLDSLNKRVDFLKSVSEKLELDVTAIHGRAEALGRESEYREKFDIATARAVTNLPALLEYTLPLLKTGGKFLAMKGKDTADEIEASKTALSLLCGEIEQTDRLLLPDGSERTIIVVKKISQISSKYPRTATKINKKPL